MDERLGKAREAVLVENTAQAVFKHLDRLQDHRASFGGRWVWELLQNARDAGRPDGVAVGITFSGTTLTFTHDGDPFSPREVAHLIYHGSTKVESLEDLIHFGSGFLSTHLLSRTVRVRGGLEDGRVFEFTLDRAGETVAELHAAMDRSWQEFESSISGRFEGETVSTEFVYDIGDESRAFAKAGLSQLQRFAPLVLAFAPEIRSISTSQRDQTWSVSLDNRQPIDASVELVTMTSEAEGVSEQRLIAVATDADDVQAAIPLRVDESGISVDLDPATPRVFIVFPLLTTERLPLPAVINSKRFKPLEDRDGLVLKGELDRIAENRSRFERASPLMMRLLDLAAQQRWARAEQLVRFDTTALPDWVDHDWIHEYLRRLLDHARGTSLVVAVNGEQIPPKNAWVPFDSAESRRAVLWDLAASWVGADSRLPQRELAESWSENLMHWTSLRDRDELNESLTCSALAQLVDEVGTGASLRVRVPNDTIESWLNRFLALVCDAQEMHLLDQYSLLLTQAHSLRKRTDGLFADAGIDERLKAIAVDLGHDLHERLLHPSVDIPVVVDLLPVKEPAEALDETLSALKGNAHDDKLPASLVGASAALFSWIARSAPYKDRLNAFPAITSEETDGAITLLELSRFSERRPLAPPPLWRESSRQFAHLFPKWKVLHPALATTLDEIGEWESLSELGYVYRTPLHDTHKVMKRFLADELLVETDETEHQTAEEVKVSDIAFLDGDVGLIDTARKSKTRAVSLFRFLMEAVLADDATAFDSLQVACECGASHHCYRAGWLVPLRDRKWIPVGDGSRAVKVSAESLANLLRDHVGLVETLANEKGDLLLRALGVSPPDFQLRVVAQDEITQKALVLSIGELARAVGGDVSRVQSLVSEIREHPEILADIEERRLQRAKVKKNQALGSLVEDLLKAELEGRGLTVRRTGIGSDFEVESDFIENGEEVALEIASESRSILIEVKSARAEHVRMTPAQAKTANEQRSRFALCVVPVDDDSPSPELVAERCRFVFEIGALVAPRWSDYVDVRDVTTVARGQAGPVEVDITEGQVRFKVKDAVWLNQGLDLKEAVKRISSAATEQT